MTRSMDEAVREAWRHYELELGMRLAGLVDDLILGVPHSGEQEVFIALVADDEAPVRAQLVMTAEAEQNLQASSWEAIRLLGWEVQPGALGEGSTTSLVSQQGDPDEMAALACATMRSVFSVPSPEFIEEDEIATDPTCPAHSQRGCDVIVDGVTDGEQLHGLVRDALQCHFGRVIEPDDDGDFPVRYGSALVWVRVETDFPAIQMWSNAVSGVRRQRQAAIEVGLLNRDTRGVTFVLLGDTVVAKTDLWASVFSGEVFRSTLANLAGAVDALDEDLAVRVGGQTFFQEAS